MVKLNNILDIQRISLTKSQKTIKSWDNRRRVD